MVKVFILHWYQPPPPPFACSAPTLPPPPPPPPLYTGILHFMGIKSYSKLHRKGISWTKDLSSPWESNSELPTQKAAHKPTIESLVLKLVLSTELWGPNPVVWPFESKLLSTSLLCAVCDALQGGSNFWVCEWNPMVWPFKWKLLSSAFLWYCLLCCTR